MTEPTSSDVNASRATTLPPSPAGRDNSLRVARPAFYLLIAVSGVSLALSGLLWQRLGNIQEQLARQSADTGTQAVEARAAAREAQDLARQTAARLALTDTRVAEMTVQRSQLDDLIQRLSLSRDENIAADIESALRIAQQQSELTLSPEPLLSALRMASQRLSRSEQPRLARVQAAVQRDLERIKSSAVMDVPALLVRLDEMARLADELPVANAVGPAVQRPVRRDPSAPPPAWWEQALGVVRDEARGLLRVSRIEQPEAALMTPEQSFFLRENLKLKLLNARLSLLARQTELARADLAAAEGAINRYFDAGRRTQNLVAGLQQIQGQLRQAQMPRVDDTLALLDATAAGR